MFSDPRILNDVLGSGNWMQLGDLSMCNDSAPLALQGRFGAQTWSDKL